MSLFSNKLATSYQEVKSSFVVLVTYELILYLG